ncbi:hypothetical protein YB2330_004230 [Saitoella coloradoensis]|uniref:Uncharacterized protein n=1 Tax=Saitoella complicata (strain BCRC 22490 / CBS 7301 / JCM 7358 / NBRC 10748 / NRRL Y-17804) TaxID=698492 RepID=A0A0E9NH96_SAICN|nr:hypothetical protein G7K_3410-t1 [Saitoella complicata NRRL Y-17804]
MSSKFGEQVTESSKVGQGHTHLRANKDGEVIESGAVAPDGGPSTQATIEDGGPEPLEPDSEYKPSGEGTLKDDL